MKPTVRQPIKRSRADARRWRFLLRAWLSVCEGVVPSCINVKIHDDQGPLEWEMRGSRLATDAMDRVVDFRICADSGQIGSSYAALLLKVDLGPAGMESRDFKPNLSFLDLVNRCNSFHLPTNHGSDDPPASTYRDYVVPWSLSQSADSPVIGLLKPEIIDVLLQEPEGTFVIPERARPGSRRRISFHPSIDTPAKRTDALKKLCERWRDSGTVFQDTIGLKKWRDEMYPVYRNPFSAHLFHDSDAGNFLFEMERSACSLFGVVTYGVHMTIYEEDADGSNVRIWTPTRSRTKQTCVSIW